MLSSFLRRGASGGDQSAKAGSPSQASKTNVLVTGAGGRTGCIVVRKLLARGGVAAATPHNDTGGSATPSNSGQAGGLVRALVRSEESKRSLLDSLGDLASSELLEVVLGDVMDEAPLERAFKGMDAVVVVTSASPKISLVSLAAVFARRLATFNYLQSRPSFWYEDGRSPEQVDWLGQRAQFEAAQAAGVGHVVLVSTMCGKRADHFVNANMGNIALWKRKAECALIASGLPYTIIHPGGLLPHPPSNEPAPGGRRELKVALDDELVDAGGTSSLVPREDLAEVCVACLLDPGAAKGRSFDLGSGEEGVGVPFTGDLRGLLAPTMGKNCSYSEADSAFSSLDKQNGRGCNCY